MFRRNGAMNKAKKRWIILLSIFIGVILAASLTFYFVFDVKNWQKLDASKLTVLAQTSTLYDGQENIITTLKGSENRTLVASTISPCIHSRLSLPRKTSDFMSIAELMFTVSSERCAATCKAVPLPKAQAPSHSSLPSSRI